MYHLKSNKLIILNSFLSLSYSLKISENLNLYYETSEDQKNQYKINKSIGLNLIGHWIYNGITLDNPIKYRIYQEVSYPDVKELEEAFSRVKELKISMDKVLSALDILNNMDLENSTSLKEATNKINNLLSGINTYFINHPDMELQRNLLLNSSVKDTLDKKLYEICKEVEVN